MIFVKGGANATIPKLRGAKTIVCFPSVKNDIVLINFIILGGSGGMLPQENF